MVNDLLARTRSGFRYSVISQNFLVQGVSIKNQMRSCQRVSDWRNKKRGDTRKNTEAGRKSLKDAERSVSTPFSSVLHVKRLVNRVGSQSFNNINGESMESESIVRRNFDASLYSLRNSQEPNAPDVAARNGERMRHLCKKEENEGYINSEWPYAFPLDKRSVSLHKARPLIKLENQGLQKKRVVPECKAERTINCILEPCGGKTARFIDNSETGKTRTSFSLVNCKKQRDRKSVEVPEKEPMWKRFRVLDCVMSRRRQAAEKNIEDKDYQKIEIVNFKHKPLSDVSGICDNSVIDAVAKENLLKTQASFLPQLTGSNLRLRDRYVAELAAFNPATPILREYARISQARVVEFSNSALSSKIL